MINFPNQLKNGDFRFIKIRPESKLPAEKGWNKTKNYPYTSVILAKYMVEDNIYGVATGTGNLIVLDCDLRLMERIAIEKLPPTFKVRTPGNGCHLYYICPDFPKTKLLKHPIIEDLKGAPLHLGEIRSIGSEVVGPGSFNAKKGKYYLVEDNIEIAQINTKQINDALGNFILNSKEKVGEEFIERNPDLIEAFPLIEVMERYGFDISTNPTNCLWHDSRSGKCFGYGFGENNTGWNCFHCLKGGSVINLVAEMEGITYREAVALLRKKLLEKTQ